MMMRMTTAPGMQSPLPLVLHMGGNVSRYVYLPYPCDVKGRSAAAVLASSASRVLLGCKCQI